MMTIEDAEKRLQDAEIERLMEELREAREEIERLQAVADGDFKRATELTLKRAEYPAPDGSLLLELQATAIPLIAEHLAQIFQREGGQNYLGIEFNHPDLGPFTLSIQRRFGETPAAKAARLTAELEEARELVQRFADCAWTQPSMSGADRLMGLNSPKYMKVYPDARAFLDKAGK